VAAKAAPAPAAAKAKPPASGELNGVAAATNAAFNQNEVDALFD
jgi:hypothetical protein